MNSQEFINEIVQGDIFTEQNLGPDARCLLHICNEVRFPAQSKAVLIDQYWKADIINDVELVILTERIELVENLKQVLDGGRDRSRAGYLEGKISGFFGWFLERLAAFGIITFR